MNSFTTILLLVGVTLLPLCNTRGVFWETKQAVDSRLQRVPPAEVTASIMEEYLLHRHSKERLVRREVEDDYPTDVLFIIDSSKSVPEHNFTVGLKALQNLVMRFPQDTHFASILYSTKAEVNFPFVPANQAMEQLIRIKYNGGFTNTQAALKMAKKLFRTSKSGIRWDAYKTIFILTDGQSNIKKSKTLYRALQLKLMGITVYVMAVGERIEGISELAMLATSTNYHMYRVAEMDGFMDVVRRISRDHGYVEATDFTQH